MFGILRSRSLTCATSESCKEDSLTDVLPVANNQQVDYPHKPVFDTGWFNDCSPSGVIKPSADHDMSGLLGTTQAEQAMTFAGTVAEYLSEHLREPITEAVSRSVETLLKAQQECLLDRVQENFKAMLQMRLTPPEQEQPLAGSLFTDRPPRLPQRWKRKHKSKDMNIGDGRHSAQNNPLVEKPDDDEISSSSAQSAGKSIRIERPPEKARHGSPRSMWHAVCNFVATASNPTEESGAPPALQSLQDACVDDLLAEHRIGLGDRGSIRSLTSKGLSRHITRTPSGSTLMSVRSAGKKGTPDVEVDQVVPYHRNDHACRSGARHITSSSYRSEVRISSCSSHSAVELSGRHRCKGDLPDGDQMSTPDDVLPGYCSQKFLRLDRETSRANSGVTNSYFGRLDHEPSRANSGVISGLGSQMSSAIAGYQSEPVDGTTPVSAMPKTVLTADSLAVTDSDSFGSFSGARERGNRCDSEPSTYRGPRRHTGDGASRKPELPLTPVSNRRHSVGAAPSDLLRTMHSPHSSFVGSESRASIMTNSVSAHGQARNPCSYEPSTSSGQDNNSFSSSFVERLKRRVSDHLGSHIDEVQSLRIARETDLLQEIDYTGNDADDDDMDGESQLSDYSGPASPETPSRKALNRVALQVASPLVLRLWGILPWRGTPARTPKRRCSGFCMGLLGCTASDRYRLVILCLASAAVAASVENLVVLQTTAVRDGQGLDTPMLLHLQELTDLVVALGSFLGLVSMHRLVSLKILGHTKARLVAYAKRVRLLKAWSRISMRQGAVLVPVWMLMVAARVMAPVPAHVPHDVLVGPIGRRQISIAIFAFASGLFLAQTYAILHVVSMFPLMVDAFCFHFVKKPHLESNVRDWSILQAVLRRASGAVEQAFLVLETCTLMAVIVALTAMAQSPTDWWMHGWLLLAVLILAAVHIRLFFKAAQVTEKCIRVPSLVNSLSFGLDVDLKRHFLVEYLTYSDAGFYVQDVRVTAAMAIKLTYIGGLVAFGVGTRVATAV